MTQFDQTIAFFEGLGYTRFVGNAISDIDGSNILPEKKYRVTDIVVEESNSARAIEIGSGIGYAGIYCKFFFSADGKLVNHGCWE